MNATWETRQSLFRPEFVEHLLPGLTARNYDGVVCLLEPCWNHNGSGKNAFGGAEKWPALHARFSFMEGDEARRDEFVEALKKFTADFFEKGAK